MEEYAVVFDHVSKIYRLEDKEKSSEINKRNKKDKAKKKEKQLFYALRDISLAIPKGEVTGIVGTNGSGKSTMATILAGISGIDEGSLSIKGEPALIAINTGMNNQITGYENIKLKGALLGLKPQKIKEITEGVAEFSELGDFLYQPVKKYSSGMRSRLGFSINLCLDPDILIVDEALSVGDKGFAEKCMKKMTELKEKDNKTVVFISHSLQMVEEFCEKAIWIEGGCLQDYGDALPVCKEYSGYVDYLNSLGPAKKKEENERKFQSRIIKNGKEKTCDKFMVFLKDTFN